MSGTWQSAIQEKWKFGTLCTSANLHLVKRTLDGTYPNNIPDWYATGPGIIHRPYVRVSNHGAPGKNGQIKSVRVVSFIFHSQQYNQ